MYVEKSLNKENLDLYLNELAEEYKKLSKEKTPIELIMVGGASIILNYNFRASTGDIDVVVLSSSVIKEAIKKTAAKLGLSHQWLNDDVKNTKSYSKNLSKVSSLYKIFSNILEVRKVDAEYLIAMKLMAGRNYKYDLSDIVGIMREHKKNNKEITLKKIDDAIIELYGSWENITNDIKKFIEMVSKCDNYEKLYQNVREQEEKAENGFEENLEILNNKPEEADEIKILNEINNKLNR